MKNKLSDTQSWLDDFSSRWDKVLARTSPSSKRSLSNLGSNTDFQTAPDYDELKIMDLPRLTKFEFRDMAENELNDLSSKYNKIARLVRGNVGDIEQLQEEAQVLEDSIRALQNDAVEALNELFCENNALQGALREQEEDFKYSRIIDPYNTYSEEIQGKIDHVCTFNAAYGSLSHEENLNFIVDSLKRVKKAVAAEYSIEIESLSKLKGIPRKAEMSGQCLTNLLSSNSKIEEKLQKNSKMTQNIHKTLTSMNNENMKLVDENRNLLSNLREQAEINKKSVVVLDNLKSYYSVSCKAQGLLNTYKEETEEAGLEILRTLRRKIQKSHDFKSIDLCNQISSHLIAIYSYKHTAEAKEHQLSKHISRMKATEAYPKQLDRQRSSIFSFDKV